MVRVVCLLVMGYCWVVGLVMPSCVAVLGVMCALSVMGL